MPRRALSFLAAADTGKIEAAMKYRAIAIDRQRDGHPIQILSNVLADVHDWAHKVSNQLECYIDIYEIYERKIKRVKPTESRPPRA